MQTFQASTPPQGSEHGTDLPITVVILTRDEELHIERAIGSVQPFARRVVVVDSGSSDGTAEIARRMGAEVIVHPFVTQAQQFNWTLTQLPDETEWVLRLDADEIIMPELARAITASLPTLGAETTGVYLNRRMSFLGRSIRHAGLFPVKVLRLFRFGYGRSEDRWMDEHIVVDGGTTHLDGELLDDNLKPLTWWIAKHNSYASREVVDVLLQHEIHHNQHLEAGSQTSGKRWIKEKIYYRLPAGFRAFAYFLYRYVLRLGFLDGAKGAQFHILQGFWYRYLVDAKLNEVLYYQRQHDVDLATAIERVLDIDVRIGRVLTLAESRN